MGRSVTILSHLVFSPKARDGVLGPSFASLPFFSIDAVGSEKWTALHEYIDCGTHQRAPSNSSIKLLSVRVLDFDLGSLLNDQIPRHRSIFSWSLPLALKFGEHFMSTSMVTLTKGFSITRPASRAVESVERWLGGMYTPPLKAAFM